MRGEFGYHEFTEVVLMRNAGAISEASSQDAYPDKRKHGHCSQSAGEEKNYIMMNRCSSM